MEVSPESQDIKSHEKLEIVPPPPRICNALNIRELGDKFSARKGCVNVR